MWWCRPHIVTDNLFNLTFRARTVSITTIYTRTRTRAHARGTGNISSCVLALPERTQKALAWWVRNLACVRAWLCVVVSTHSNLAVADSSWSSYGMCAVCACALARVWQTAAVARILSDPEAPNCPEDARLRRWWRRVIISDRRILRQSAPAASACARVSFEMEHCTYSIACTPTKHTHTQIDCVYDTYESFFFGAHSATGSIYRAHTHTHTHIPNPPAVIAYTIVHVCVVLLCCCGGLLLNDCYPHLPRCGCMK